jgi:hypothetical protein
VLVGRRAQRLGQQGEVGHAQRELATPGANRDAVDADQVAKVEPDELVEARVAELIHAGVQLQPTGAVDEVDERGTAGLAARGDPTGHAMGHRRLLAGASASCASATLASDSTPGKAWGNGSTPSARRRSSFARRAASSSASPWSSPLTRGGYLRPTSILVILSLRAGPRGTCTETVSLRL